MAAKEFPNTPIAVVDSKNLSTGVGHTVIRAAELAQEGLGALEIKEELDKFTPLVRASFVVDTITAAAAALRLRLSGLQRLI